MHSETSATASSTSQQSVPGTPVSEPTAVSGEEISSGTRKRINFWSRFSAVWDRLHRKLLSRKVCYDDSGLSTGEAIGFIDANAQRDAVRRVGMSSAKGHLHDGDASK